MNEEKKEAVETEIAPVVGAEAPAAAIPAASVPETALQPAPVAVATGCKPAEALAKKPAAASSPAMVVEASVPRRSSGFSRYAALAAVVATAIGLGWMGGWATSLASAPDGASAATLGSARQWLAATLGGPRPEPGEARQLAGDIQALKAGLDDVRASLERNRTDDAQHLAQFGERLDCRPQGRSRQRRAARRPASARRASDGDEARESGRTLRQGRARGSRPDPAPHPDRRAARSHGAPARPAPAASPKPAANEPAQTGAVAEPKPATVENWALRDVYNGVALIEGKNRRLMEIVPGQNLPGLAASRRSSVVANLDRRHEPRDHHLAGVVSELVADRPRQQKRRTNQVRLRLLSLSSRASVTGLARRIAADGRAIGRMAGFFTRAKRAAEARGGRDQPLAAFPRLQDGTQQLHAFGVDVEGLRIQDGHRDQLSVRRARISRRMGPCRQRSGRGLVSSTTDQRAAISPAGRRTSAEVFGPVRSSIVIVRTALRAGVPFAATRQSLEMFGQVCVAQRSSILTRSESPLAPPSVRAARLEAAGA
jgi:hypothetical protein